MLGPSGATLPSPPRQGNSKVSARLHLAPYLPSAAALPPPTQAAPVLASDPWGYGEVIHLSHDSAWTQLL